jgi:hypothetical protein
MIAGNQLRSARVGEKGGKGREGRLWIASTSISLPYYHLYTTVTSKITDNMFPTALRSATHQARTTLVRSSTPLSLSRGNVLNVGKRFNTQESRGGKSKLVGLSGRTRMKHG